MLSTFLIFNLFILLVVSSPFLCFPKNITHSFLMSHLWFILLEYWSSPSLENCFKRIWFYLRFKMMVTPNTLSVIPINIIGWTGLLLRITLNQLCKIFTFAMYIDNHIIAGTFVWNKINFLPSEIMRSSAEILKVIIPIRKSLK